MLPDIELSRPKGHGIATYPPGATFGPRVMRDFEFVWIIQGETEYRWGDRIVPAPPGSILLCRPGATDFFRWDTHRRTRHGYFHFDLRRHPRRWPKMANWPLVRHPEEGDILRPLFRHLLTWADRGDDGQCRLGMAHLLTAYITGQFAAKEVPFEALPDAVERANRFLHARLDAHPDAPIRLAEIADAAKVTPEHLCRLFKSVTGFSPAETVRRARLDRAMTLLSRSNYSVKEIAHLSGFSSQFHFSRCFKTAFDRSPIVWRRRLQQGHPPPRPLSVAVQV